MFADSIGIDGDLSNDPCVIEVSWEDTWAEPVEPVEEEYS